MDKKKVIENKKNEYQVIELGKDKLPAGVEDVRKLIAEQIGIFPKKVYAIVSKFGVRYTTKKE